MVLAQNLVDDLIYLHSSKHDIIYALCLVSFLAKKCFAFKEGDLIDISNIVQKLCPNMLTSYQTF